jgi:hypothetical protein
MWGSLLCTRRFFSEDPFFETLKMHLVSTSKEPIFYIFTKNNFLQKGSLFVTKRRLRWGRGVRLQIKAERYHNNIKGKWMSSQTTDSRENNTGKTEKAPPKNVLGKTHCRKHKVKFFDFFGRNINNPKLTFESYASQDWAEKKPTNKTKKIFFNFWEEL